MRPFWLSPTGADRRWHKTRVPNAIPVGQCFGRFFMETLRIALAVQRGAQICKLHFSFRDTLEPTGLGTRDRIYGECTSTKTIRVGNNILHDGGPLIGRALRAKHHRPESPATSAFG